MIKPATYEERIGAFIIDGVCFAAVIWPFGKLMQASGDRDGSLTALLVIFVLPPLAALCCWLAGNTPGKKVWGLRIVDETSGRTPSFWQFFKRSVLFIFLIPANFVFVIPLVVTRRRRAFHDMIAGTLVVRQTESCGSHRLSYHFPASVLRSKRHRPSVTRSGAVAVSKHNHSTATRRRSRLQPSPSFRRRHPAPRHGCDSLTVVWQGQTQTFQLKSGEALDLAAEWVERQRGLVRA